MVSGRQSGNSQGAAVEDGRWGGGVGGQAGFCEVVSSLT